MFDVVSGVCVVSRWIVEGLFMSVLAASGGKM